MYSLITRQSACFGAQAAPAIGAVAGTVGGFADEGEREGVCGEAARLTTRQRRLRRRSKAQGQYPPARAQRPGSLCARAAASR
eukprot:3328494-Pleurochrysis_carterae.AAC.2